MTRSFKYPLRPTRAQAAVITRWLGLCCDLYNAGLQERREAWRIQKKRIGFFEQVLELTEIRAEDEAIRDLPAQASRFALRRLDQAFKAFFRRCKTGGAPGYPRFRSRRRYDSVSFGVENYGCSIKGNRIRVPKLGPVRFHRYRPLEGTPKHITIGRDGAGKWFLAVLCEIGDAPPKVAVRSAVGIDLGLTTFATLSDGVEVENPRWFRAGADRLRLGQQTLFRRKPGSASRERARVRVARAHAHIANQRSDFARKLACELFKRYDLVAHEDLDVARMARGHFAKSIHDAGWNVFLQALHGKAERAGRHAVAVDPRGTTQRCSGCGETVPKGIGVRVHVCACGVTLGRDHNAALNVLRLGWSRVEVATAAVETEGHLSPATGPGTPFPLARGASR